MSERKGIILAGGIGTRLYPSTLAISKHLLPVFDKPMVYYPLTTLMQAGIREMLLISTPNDIARFQALLGDGSQWGISLQYAVQPVPAGIADAFRVGGEFIGDNPCALILGDNIFHGPELGQLLLQASRRMTGATVFAHEVSNAARYGIIELDSMGRPLSIEEKPKHPRSDLAVTGLYFYDNQVRDHASALVPSARGELEITDINMRYLTQGTLDAKLLGAGFAWLDAGTHDSLLDASSYVATLQHRQGRMIGCPEEAALAQDWITVEHVETQALKLEPSPYATYLRKICRSTWA